MSSQVRSMLRQKCLIRGRRLLCSEATSKASPKTKFSTFSLSANSMFAYGLASAIVVFTSVNVFKDSYPNYPVYKAIFKDTRPLIMEEIAGDLTRKLCETSTSITQSHNVGDDSDYVTRPSLENRILKASEQSLKNKGGAYTIIVGAKGAGKTSAVARVLRAKKGMLALLVSDNDRSESTRLNSSHPRLSRMPSSA